MSEHEFVIWLKGFVAGSNNYNLTPTGWEELKTQLEKVYVYNEPTPSPSEKVF